MKNLNEEKMDFVSAALGFAACAHKDQKRKYTGEPYVTHCRNVMDIVAQHTTATAPICAAALHDCIEDTSVTRADIEEVFGKDIADLVEEVTDVSRPGHGNRAVRKQMDREHIAKSSSNGATIKLADLIDNTSSIVKYDKDFAKIYLKEKALLLPLLQHGNPLLWELAYKTLQDAQAELVQHNLETQQLDN